MAWFHVVMMRSRGEGVATNYVVKNFARLAQKYGYNFFVSIQDQAYSKFFRSFYIQIEMRVAQSLTVVGKLVRPEEEGEEQWK